MSFIDHEFNNEIVVRAYDRNAMKSVQTIANKTNMPTDYHTFVNKIVKQLVIDPRQHWVPHVSGWYYVNMVGGTWEKSVVSTIQDETNDYKEFSIGAADLFKKFKPEIGHLIKDIQPPQLNIDYDNISGRLRNISLATKTSMTQEFSIIWKDTSDAIVFKYHELWHDYIDAHKKGFIKSGVKYDKDSYFVDIPYFNAVWVAILKPFTYELLGLVKLMGVTPSNPIPLQDILGQRGQNQLTTYTINYKVVDCIVQMFQGKPSGNFYNEFMSDQQAFFDTSIMESLYYGSQTSLNDIKLFNN